MDAKTLVLFYQIAELRHRAEWTYKIQLSQAEKYHSRNNRLNIWAIVLAGISTLFAASGGVAQLIGCSNSWMSFVAATISGIGSILLACNQNLNYVGKIPQNVEMGAQVWRIYIDYGSLLTNLISETCSYEEAEKQRDLILDKWTKLSETAPLAFAEAVKAADKKINKNGDNQYSGEKILNTLPDYLRPQK